MNGKKSYSKGILTVFCLVLMFLSGFFPPVLGLSSVGMQVVGIFIGTVILWLGVSVTWPSLVCMIALMFSPLYTYQQVLSGSMGSWITSFVIFSSIVSFALRETGYLRRVAIWLITRPFAQKNPWVFLAVLFLGPLLIGACMSPIPAFIVFMPIAEQIFEELGYAKSDRVPQMITLCLLNFACISTMTTPIAHTVPILGMSLYEKDAGKSIDFVKYTIFGIITSLIIYVGILLVMRFVFRPDLSRFKNLDTNVLRKDIGPMSKQEKYTLGIFAAVVVLWMLPGIIGSILPGVADFLNSMGTPTPALIGAAILFMIPVEGKPLLDFTKAMTKGVPWSAVVMVAATVILGSAVTNKDAGITKVLVSGIAPLINGLSPMVFVFIITLLTIVITSFASNTVTVTLVYSVAMPLVLGGAIAGINPAALTCVIGAGAAIAVAAPPADATCAIAVGTGWLGPKLMLKYGLLNALVCALALAFIGYPLASILM